MAEQRHRPGGAVVDERSAAFVAEWLVHLHQFRCQFADVEPGELLASCERFGAADFEDGRQDTHQRVRLPDDAPEEFLLFRWITGFGGRMGG